MTIRAGAVSEATQHSGEWIFIDIGFASSKPSCGLLVGEGDPAEITFSQLKQKIISFDQTPLNLVIEAPLSIAFNALGNPTGRSIEKRGRETRYWYVGLGCSVLVAATYLLRTIHDSNQSRDIRLFEGFASFKQASTSHSQDVLNLRDIAWNPATSKGRIVAPTDLSALPSDSLTSAFLVAGMDFGIPPVIIAE